MNDDAPAEGIKRPRLATKSVYQDDSKPKTSRPILPVLGRQAKGEGRPVIPVDSVTPVTGSNDPGGMERPRLATKPPLYDQATDPDY